MWANGHTRLSEWGQNWPEKQTHLNLAMFHLLWSYALDAIDWLEQQRLGSPLKRKVSKLLWTANNAKVECQSSVGLGTDIRHESRTLTGFTLAHGEKIVHLSVFTRSNGSSEDRYTSRMQRFSSRRRNRCSG